MRSPLRSLSASSECSSVVPPSPMKPDFTSEPPVGVRPMRAMRKINLSDFSEHQTSDLSGRLSLVRYRHCYIYNSCF